MPYLEAKAIFYQASVVLVLYVECCRTLYKQAILG